MSERVRCVVASPKTDSISAMALVAMTKTTMPWSVKSTVSIGGPPVTMSDTVLTKSLVRRSDGTQSVGSDELGMALPGIAPHRTTDLGFLWNWPLRSVAMSALPPEADMCSAKSHVCLKADIPPSHSITSSAVARSDCGTVRPSALAVLRLMTSSNLVGACTGRSAGFSPLRMRST